jgi:hypothetical protein
MRRRLLILPHFYFYESGKILITARRKTNASYGRSERYAGFV